MCRVSLRAVHSPSPRGVCRPSRARVFKPRPVRHCPQRFCMSNRWSAGGLVVEDVAGFDGVEAVEADVAEGVTVGHLVVAVADFPVEHASGREIVDVSVLQHCRRGLPPVTFFVTHSAACWAVTACWARHDCCPLSKS